MNKKQLVIIGIIAVSLLSGCATANKNKLNNLRRDNTEQHNLLEIFNYSRESVFNASILAIRNKTKAIIRYSNLSKGEIYAQTSYATAIATAFIVPCGSGSNVGIFIEGDNPTKVRVAQLNYGFAHDDYKNLIMEEIKLILGLNDIQIKQTRAKLKYDAIEDDPKYKEIIKKAEEEAEKNINEPKRMGYCHILWREKKRILKEKYGIDWKTPAELNPQLIFD